MGMKHNLKKSIVLISTKCSESCGTIQASTF